MKQFAKIPSVYCPLAPRQWGAFVNGELLWTMRSKKKAKDWNKTFLDPELAHLLADVREEVREEVGKGQYRVYWRRGTI